MSVVLNKNKIQAFMKQNNIPTQTQLAKIMGISKNQLSVMLSEKFEPIKSNVAALCSALKVEPKDIISSLQEVQNEKSTNVSAKHEETDDIFVNTRGIVPARAYTSLELFAGAGGLALGLEKAGFNSAGLIEIDKNCCNTLRQNRPSWNVINEDIIHVVDKGIRNYIGNTDIDLLSGGYPCQSFSYAGKKLGLDDVRGTMFFYYAELLRELRPKMFLAENVRGLLNHDDGRTLQTMIDVFSQIGYHVVKRVLNAVNYGVAQKRERVVIIGIRNDFENITFKYPKPYDKQLTLREALKDVPVSVGAKYPETKRKVLELVPPGGYWRDLPDDIAKSYMGKSYYSGGGRTGMARRISWEEPSLTLTCSPCQKQTERCHPDETRPFTVREYARIQSFDDTWCFSGSMNDQYKQIGNAVPVNLAKEIGLAIINTLNEINR